MEELTPALQRFSVEVVEASRQVSREAIAYCLNSVIQPIVQALGRADARFKSYIPMPTESYFEALRVSGNEEYELLIVLDSLVTMKTFRDPSESNPNFAGYGEVMFTQTFGSDAWAGELCLPLGHAGQGQCFLLSATRVRQYFAKLVSMIAVDIFHNGTVQVSFKGMYSRKC